MELEKKKKKKKKPEDYKIITIGVKISKSFIIYEGLSRLFFVERFVL